MVLHLLGDIDMADAPSLASAVETALRRAADSRAKLLVLDLSDVDYCGSVFLRMLAELKESAPVHGVALRVVATGAFRRLLEVTGLDDFFNLHDSLRDALPAEVSPEF